MFVFPPRVEVAVMLVTCSIEQGAGQTLTIGSIDGLARSREFVATAREKGLRVTAVRRMAPKQERGNQQGRSPGARRER
jgi:hypothetical protein